MKFWNAIEAVIRYVLAAVACVFVVEFVFLLVFGTKTENTYSLATQLFGKAILCGGVAAWLFYRARKSRLKKQAPHQAQPPPIPQNPTEEQVAPQPLDSVSATPSAPVPTPMTDRPGSSLQKAKATILIIGVVLAVAVLVSLTRGPSQPRFTHHGGAPEQMFDTKTSQECWAGPVQKDDGFADANRASERVQKASDAFLKAPDQYACFRALDKNPNGPRPLVCGPSDLAFAEYNSAIDASDLAGKRFMYLHEHPENQKVIQVNGLPYCKDLK